MRIVFFGTPEFAAEILETLLKQQADIAAVVTRPDTPKKRSKTPTPSPVKEVAMRYYLPVHQPEKASSPDFFPILQACQADLFVVVAYGEIIKQQLLDMPRLGCINVHPSLLPKYRGANPIQCAIINGETETGVTIMHMVRKMDAGNIIRQKKVPIGPLTSADELSQALCKEGAQALLEVIHQFAQGNVSDISQREEEATFTSKIALEDCEIQWNQPAAAIHNLVRGVFPKPGAWCWANLRGAKKRLKILRTEPQENKTIPPGGVMLQDGKMFIGCAQGSLEVQRLKLEGKKSMSASEFFRGIDVSEIYFV